MIELFQMWLLVEVIGIACLPLTMTVCHNLADRGWAFSKAIGICLFTFCIWFPLSSLHFLPFSRVFIEGVFLILLVGSLVGFWCVRSAILKIVHRNFIYVVSSELVFLGMIFLLGWLRSYRPDIRNFEMFMDEGFIAAIMRSPHLPPNDMWFAGYTINYYYYAHFTVAMLAKLIGQSPSIAFNTGISMFFGLTATNLFGVTCNIVSWSRYIRTQRRNQLAPFERPDQIYPSLLRAIPYGLFTMFAGLMLGNLATTQQWWENHGDGLLQANFNWFSPSRVIPKTINEFPAFSFLLSCFHAHVLTLAFTILAIGLAFNLFLAPYGLEGRGLHVFGERWQIPCTLFVTALVIGGLFVMNGWDYPTYMGLALVSIIIQQWLAHDTQFNVELFTNILIPAAFLVALSFILFIPFYRNFTSPSQGIGIVNATDRSNLSDELLIYGLFAFMYISLLVASVLKRPLFSLSELRKGGSNNSSTIGSDRFWFIISIVTTTALACIELALLIFMKNGVTFVITGSIALLGMIVLIVNLGDRAHSFALLLGATAFAVIAMCEVIFLKDVFADSFPRMNTVFKFYFQAWALLSITSGYGLFFLLENFFSFGLSSAPLRWLSRGGQVFWLTGLLALLLASMAYPLLAPTTRLAHYDFSMRKLVLTRTNSLDGLTYLQQCRPPDLDPDPTPFCTFDVRSDYAAIRWINANIQGDPTIVEAIGNDYTLYGRVSIFTGLPTLMGWGGHEVQWRTNWLNTPDHIGEFNQRYADVDLIYTNPDAQSVLATMAHYNAQYLYVGSLEHIKYPHANLERFGTFMQVVYNASGVTIYKVKDAGKG